MSNETNRRGFLSKSAMAVGAAGMATAALGTPCSAESTTSDADQKKLKVHKVKITVIKTLNTEELHGDSDLGCSAGILTPTCPVFKKGQEFIWPLSGDNSSMPEGFNCGGAWADIYRHIEVLAFHGQHYWMDQDGKYLACCTDGFRPVVFLLERLDEEGA